MSHWNYRVIRHPNEDGEEVFGIHEVHYNKRNRVEGYTEDPIIVGNSKEELMKVLLMMMRALETPVIDKSNG